MDNPETCLKSNVVASCRVFEAASRHATGRVVYASSSSVYGAKSGTCRESDPEIAPMSLYGTSKRCVELLARSYWESRGLRTVGARLSTVYGEWVRPDMAYFRLLVSAHTGVPLPLMTDVEVRRDFTYITDSVDVLVALLDRAPEVADPAQLVNVGGGTPVTLASLIRTVEEVTGRQIEVHPTSGTPGDVPRTGASTERLRALKLPLPATSVREGVERTAAWIAPIISDAHRWVDAASR